MEALQEIPAASAANEAKARTHSDADRLAAAVSMHSPAVYSMALRKAGNIEDAEAHMNIEQDLISKIPSEKELVIAG